MTDGDTRRDIAANPGNETPPNPDQRSSAEASAPVSDPARLADEVTTDTAPETVGGAVTEPTAGQEGAADSEAPLGNLEAMQDRLDRTPVDASGEWARGAWTDPDLEKHPAVRELRAVFPHAVLDIIRFRDETTIHISREEFRNVAFFLRDHDRLALNFLTDLSAVDMLRLRTEPRFDVVAQLYSIPNRVRLRLKTGCDDGETVPSLVPVWNGANWLEREVYDMFGIIFEGHPNLRRMLLPDDWDEGHPLRKDYPLRGWKEFPVYNTERVVPRVRTRWTGRGV
ncbi:MAG: NADH-ubiquinone oxidoreductase chain C [uncultured Thermomicrobiales bacterium]|uniref:NADH-quinone oxidoreductase subunit C n=1 Tax=uncultured Thermomicrobiales bacterium TaxID=1645740 RepID=A0A6J4UCJ6_9BACT|nr:MAG: NADH-ubiquinone oxidoreductase chain C [uncultured Thermomicrobiales bacterium]